jgi:hypothetical protein
MPRKLRLSLALESQAIRSTLRSTGVRRMVK